jgi:DNA polymerase-3 subunit delta'
MKDETQYNFSWHKTQLTRVHDDIQKDHLPHALLLWGGRGLGKHFFASTLAKTILCLEKQVKPCGHCQSCHWFLQHTHPDYIVLQPQEGKEVISVDSVRGLFDKLNQTSVAGNGIVVTVRLLEFMNTQAYNALLKLLEEPPSKVYFLLLSEQAALLPQTIRSRCQTLYFPFVEEVELRAYLQTKGISDEMAFILQGAPLLAETFLTPAYLDFRQKGLRDALALSMNQASPIQIALAWQKEKIDELIDFLLSVYLDVLKLKMACSNDSLVNQDSIATLKGCAGHLEKAHVLNILETLVGFKKALLAKANINKQLWLEDLAIRLSLDG